MQTLICTQVLCLKCPRTSKTLLIRVDSLAIATENSHKQLEYIARILEFGIAPNLKFHPSKCQYFNNSITPCGIIIYAESVRYNSRHVSGLENMKTPTIASKLLQFMSSMQWLRTSTPEYSVIKQSFLDALECSYNVSGKRTNPSLNRIILQHIRRGGTEIDAFENCKLALSNRIQRAHRDHSKHSCIYVDGSDTHWAGITTQILIKDMHLLHNEKCLEPLSLVPDHSQASVRKVTRWAVCLR